MFDSEKQLSARGEGERPSIVDSSEQMRSRKVKVEARKEGWMGQPGGGRGCRLVGVVVGTEQGCAEMRR